MIDALERPVIGGDSVPGNERATVLTRMSSVPGVAVADTEITQGLLPGEEPQTRGIGLRIEIASQDHVRWSSCDSLFDYACHQDRLDLSLTLMVDLKVREVVDDVQWTE